MLLRGKQYVLLNPLNFYWMQSALTPCQEKREWWVPAYTVVQEQGAINPVSAHLLVWPQLKWQVAQARVSWGRGGLTDGDDRWRVAAWFRTACVQNEKCYLYILFEILWSITVFFGKLNLAGHLLRKQQVLKTCFLEMHSVHLSSVIYCLCDSSVVNKKYLWPLNTFFGRLICIAS